MDSLKNSVYFDCHSSPPDVFQVVRELDRTHIVECVKEKERLPVLRFQTKGSTSVGAIMAGIRSKIRVGAQDALYVFTESGKLLKTGALVSEIAHLKNKNGVIRLIFSEEKTFG